MVGEIVLFCVTYTYTIITNLFSYRMGAGIYDYKELSHQAELYTGRWNTIVHFAIVVANLFFAVSSKVLDNM